MQYSEDDRDRRIVQLRKGILELAIMGALYRDRHYGYSLIRVLSDAGSLSLKEGTVYPILARLDRDGLVKSEWIESGQGPPRKYYALTSAGRRLFDDLKQEFEALASLVQKDWPAAEPAGKKLVVRKG